MPGLASDQSSSNAPQRRHYRETVCRDYRHILALLILVAQEKHLFKFIEAQMSDSQLPLRSDDQRLQNIFISWEDRRSLKQLCGFYQPRLTVQFFQLNPLRNPEVYEIKSGTSSHPLWYDTHQYPDESHTDQAREGGYGEVRQVTIHPWQHEFSSILESPNLFALKTLKRAQDTRRLFFNEVDMLSKFGKDEKQNVRLLASIIEVTREGSVKYSFLFPWAECDLREHWEKSGVKGAAEILWVSEQCYGLADALSFIHDPGLLNDNKNAIYGRHGDIKPENILWFRNDRGQMLAFSDMGLAEVHKDSSRSNIPGEGIPHTPTYRPPECDIAGEEGYISRSFDIWTLGCVFLEFVVWILKGPKGIAGFREARLTEYAGPFYRTSLFFSLHRAVPSTNLPCSSDRPVLTNSLQCFRELHAHKDCTAYLHDFLDLIQERMIIVQSKDKDPTKSILRIRSQGLRTKLMKLRDQCREDKSYYTVPTSRVPAFQPLPAVKAALNEKVLEKVRAMPPMEKMKYLHFHTGKTRTTTRRKSGGDDQTS
ncbi:kinase-like domain-containing protein [Lasiosphaeria ovina]|uniref:Kinase-like domain-containing protein n=1 Tax=Lasiosphaeria ovina TaxID=92902 RepID=A0AAE0KE40_9PEZI|nr:kinase-like domain-containing protein [Lasiosphaeria ovina]